MTSFLVTWFSNLHILWNLPKAICLKKINAIDCEGQVLQRDYKNTIPYFVKLIISYQRAKFQIPELSESNFTEVGIRTPETIIMSQYLVSKAAHFVELNRSY